MKFKRISESFRTVSSQQGSYAAVMTVIVLAALLLINLIAAQIPWEIDLTRDKLFSLSEQTIQVLSHLDEEVTVYGIYRTGRESREVLAVLNQYAQASPYVSLRTVDPDMNPLFMSKYDPEGIGIRSGSIIIEQNENFQVISPLDLYEIGYNHRGEAQIMGFSVEQRITGAILFISSGIEQKIYELTGHGEHPLAQYGLKEALEREHFTIETLNLSVRTEIPEDASTLVMVSPKQDLHAREAELLREYLEGGGRAVILLDFVSFDEMSNLEALLRSFGIELVRGVVMEDDPSYLVSADNPFFLHPHLESHTIIEPLKSGSMSVLIPNAVSFMPAEVRRRELLLEPLITTSMQARVRTEYQLDTRILPSDVQGQAVIAYAVRNRFEDPRKLDDFRLVVIGSAQFLGSLPTYGTLKGNIDFFLNTISWVNERSESVSIRPKSLFSLPLRMNGLQVFVYSGIAVVVMPVLLFAVGIAVWQRRRHL